MIDDNDVELLERCRGGDREAFAALVSLWSELSVRVAFLIARDRVRAALAVRDALVACWGELPGLHSERAFRPWLMRKVVDAAAERAAEPTADAAPARVALDALSDDDRAIAVLSSFAAFSPAEVALARGLSFARATQRVRAADKALAERMKGTDVRAALVALAAAAEVPPALFDAISPRLEDAHELEVRRMLNVDARTAWATMVDPGALEAWCALSGMRVRPAATLRAGTQVRGRGRIAEARASRDETLFTRAEHERLLAWRTRSAPGGIAAAIPGTIEFRWTLEVAPRPEGCELVHRLVAVAFAPGRAGRAHASRYAKVSSGMQASMHHGIERLAALAAARAHTGTSGR